MGSTFRSGRWYALHVRQRGEDNVSETLRRKGFDVFAPARPTERMIRRRKCTIRVPLFPGYIFCQLDASQPLPVLTVPGVMSILGFGRQPAPVEPAELEAINKLVETGVHSEPWNLPRVGQPARIESGPLAGVEGVFLNDCGKDRILLSVTLLNRALAVEVPRDWVIGTTAGPAAHRSEI